MGRPAKGEGDPEIIAFLDQYLVDFNGSAAARRIGVDAKQAAKKASEWLRIPWVQAEFTRRCEERTERLDVTVDRVVQELCAIAFSDILDYAQITTEEIDEDVGTGVVKRTRQIVKVVDTKNLTRKQRKAVAELRPEFDKFGNRVIGVKLHGKEKALELLGKHLGMWAATSDTKAQALVESMLESMRGRVSESAYVEVSRFIARSLGVEEVGPAQSAGSGAAPAVH